MLVTIVAFKKRFVLWENKRLPSGPAYFWIDGQDRVPTRAAKHPETASIFLSSAVRGTEPLREM